MRIVLEPCDPRWVSDFFEIKSELTEALKAVSYQSIEHVGSTSVPGLIAKPIIDIDIIVTRQNVQDAISACKAIGYEYMGEWGVPDRHALRAPSKSPDRNLYVCVEGCFALMNRLAVRDTLKLDTGLRNEYAAVKVRLASQDLSDMDEYCEGKNEVVSKILENVSIRKEESATNERMNTTLH